MLLSLDKRERDLIPHDDNQEYVQDWLTNCMPHHVVRLNTARNLKNGQEREVWDCTFSTDEVKSAVILTVFKPGTLDSVNTSLPPEKAAYKCVLAMTELPALGIPTPHVLGLATVDRKAAMLCEKIERTEWSSGVRIEAARILARIHNLQESTLSRSLQDLVRCSDPREYRTTEGKAPPSEFKRIVHGDYFSANILPVADGLRIIDWETFGWGAPMWDLGFLLGADRGLPKDEIEAVITEYEKAMPVNREILRWHRRWWAEYWEKRKKLSNHRLQSTA